MLVGASERYEHSRCKTVDGGGPARVEAAGGAGDCPTGALAGGGLPDVRGRQDVCVWRWLKAYRCGGARRLHARRRGRPKSSSLKGHQAATTVRIITDRCPGSIEAALCPVDPRGGAGTHRETLGASTVGLDGGPVSEKLGLHAAEAVASGLRTEPGGCDAVAATGSRRSPIAASWPSWCSNNASQETS